jgi:hypothetical protein
MIFKTASSAAPQIPLCPDSIVSEDAGIEPRTVATTALAVRRSNHSDRSHPQIHERTISLKFLGKILRVLRLEVSVYNIFITIQFQTTFAQRGRE